MQDLFSYLSFLSRIFTFHWIAGEGEANSLKPVYHSHLLHRYLDIIQTVTIETANIYTYLPAGLEPGTFGFYVNTCKIVTMTTIKVTIEANINMN